MLVGQPQLGFSLTTPFKAVGKFVVDSHKMGTKAIVSAIKNPNVQRAAAAAGQSYVQNKYPDRYAQGADYYATAKGILRPPGPQAPIPTPAMEPPGDDGPDVAPVPGGGMAPVKKGGLTTLLLIGGAAVVIVMLMKK